MQMITVELFIITKSTSDTNPSIDERLTKSGVFIELKSQILIHKQT